ncbi:hypothetical protein QCA50_012461 [Cerrena zonata]|uniref:Ribonuclease H1 N-terminal domain-containing protein n=1 Tax=Cerrena zonata TaxID=2478898 RepID=A0AAW0FZJ7_9APHY
MSQPPDEHPPGRTPNVLIPTQLDEVRNLTLDDLPHTADRFLEPHDEPLPGETNVYVVWRGRVPGLYYRWENASFQVTGYSHSRFRRFSNITNARVAFYLLHPDHLRRQNANVPEAPRVRQPSPERPPPAQPVRERAPLAQPVRERQRHRSRECSPHSSDEYWAASEDTVSEDFIEVERHLSNLRLHNPPVPSSTPVSSTSSLSQSTLAERRSNTSRPSTRVADINTEAGPSSGVRQQPRNTWYFEGDEQDCGERNWYEGKYFVVVVGLSPGVYRHMGTARVASGLLPDTVICTAASEEEANAMFVAEYMRQRVRRLRD